MIPKSIYGRGESGLTRGALNSLAPPGVAQSKMPDALVDGKADPDTRELDCDNLDKDEPACQVAEANQELKDEQNVKS